MGKTNEPLSKEGTELLESYKMQGLYPDVEYLFTSPMQRCMDTAKIIYPTLCPIAISEWEEIDFGRFEYRNYEELKNDAEYQEWLCSGGTLGFPGGESRNDFILRCKSGFIRMCNELDQKLSQTVGREVKKPVSVGVIVHGGTIMSLLSLYAGNDYFDYQVANGRGYVCRLYVRRPAGASDRTIWEDGIRIKVVAGI